MMGTDQPDAGVENADEIGSSMEIDGADQVDQIEEPGEIPTDDFVQRILEDESNVQEMMDQCLEGGELGQEDMLQMQAVIYSYSQRVELTTKVVENATSGVKQVMNTQV